MDRPEAADSVVVESGREEGGSGREADAEALRQEQLLDRLIDQERAVRDGLRLRYLEVLANQRAPAELEGRSKISREVSVDRTKLMLLHREHAKLEQIRQEPIPKEEPLVPATAYQSHLERGVSQLKELLLYVQQQNADEEAMFESVKEAQKDHMEMKRALRSRADQIQAQLQESQLDSTFSLEEEAQSLNEKNKELFKLLKAFLVRNYPTIRPVQGEHGGLSETRLVYDIKPLLQELMNKAVQNPQNPYIEIDPLLHWTPYVEVLVGSGVAEYHPKVSNMLKLTDFHK